MGERLETILDTIGDGVIVIDAEGRIELVNQETERVFGYSRQELLGEHVHVLMPEPYRVRHDAAFHKRLNSDAPMPQRYVEVEGRRKDGTIFPLELRFSQATIAGRHVFTGALRDITDRVAAREQIASLTRELALERDYLREEVRTSGKYGSIIGESSALKLVLAQIEAVGRTQATVLVTGESGVGKELVARAIHEASPRADGPLVKVNCASIPRELFESEFFGHRKGAFTGAVRDRVGRFELANGGTIFLDEVGEIPLEQQSKLLRVLQEHEYERVGDERTRKVDVRIVAATNRDLLSEVREGRFREDLYYRLGVFPLAVPPLRERPDDIAPLAMHFLDVGAEELGLPRPRLSEAVSRQLRAYAWPGNVRELRNVMERAAILAAGGPVRLEMLALRDVEPLARATEPRRASSSPHDAETIRAALEEHQGNILQTAKTLGLSRQALYRRLDKHGIPRPGR